MAYGPINFTASAGMYSGDEIERFLQTFDAGTSEDTYIDYSIGLSTSAVGLDFALNYIGTDLDDEECFAGTKLCEPSVVASVSKSL